MATPRLEYRVNSDGTVNLVTAEGEKGSLPEAEARELFATQQARPLTQEEFVAEIRLQRQEAEDYGPVGTFLEEAARTGTLGLYDMLVGGMAAEGATPEGAKQLEQERLARTLRQREKHPGSAFLGTGVGAVGTALIPGGPVAAAGKFARGALGGGTVAARIAGAAAEGMVLGAGSGASQVALTPGEVAPETAAKQIASGAVEGGLWAGGLQAVGIGLGATGRKLFGRLRGGPEAAQLKAALETKKAWQADKDMLGRAIQKDASLKKTAQEMQGAYANLEAALKAEPTIGKNVESFITQARKQATRLNKDKARLALLEDDLANVIPLRQRWAIRKEELEKILKVPRQDPGVWARARQELDELLKGKPPPFESGLETSKAVRSEIARLGRTIPALEAGTQRLPPGITAQLDDFFRAELHFNSRLGRHALEPLGAQSGIPNSMMVFREKLIDEAIKNSQAGFWTRGMVNARTLQLGMGVAGAGLGIAAMPGHWWLGKALGFLVGARVAPGVFGGIANRLVRTGGRGRLSTILPSIGRSMRRAAAAFSTSDLDEIRSTTEGLSEDAVFTTAMKEYQKAGVPYETAVAIAEHHAGTLKAIKDAIGESDESFRRTLAVVVDPFSALERIDKDESTNEDVKALEAFAPAVRNSIGMAADQILDDPEKKWALSPEHRKTLELWSANPEHDIGFASVQNMYRANVEAEEGQRRAIRGRHGKTKKAPSAASMLDAPAMGGGPGLRA